MRINIHGTNIKSTKDRRTNYIYLVNMRSETRQISIKVCECLLPIQASRTTISAIREIRLSRNGVCVLRSFQLYNVLLWRELIY